MILSASRRTDIPGFYSEWFFNRLEEGFVDVRNPFNVHQVSRVPLSPEAVDCIVFWTKNPAPMLRHLDRLRQYKYYFQFTLSSYGKDVEVHVPDKRKVMIPVFRELSQAIGAERVVWRYDPILINERYTREYHLRAFEQIADSLSGYTKKVVISFVDLYEKTKKNTRMLNIADITDEEKLLLAGEIARMAEERGMAAEACAERIDLSPVGIARGCCIDRVMIEKIAGGKLRASKDKNQRPGCGCIESVDIGSYDTCQNGCRYCYANFNAERVRANVGRYNPRSAILCSELGPEDRVTERKAASEVDRQEVLLCL